MGRARCSFGLGTIVLVAALVVPAASASYSSTIVADSPSGYWHLDEPFGSTASDSSTKGNDGTYVGSVSLGADGAFPGSNSAASFSAQAGVQVPNPRGGDLDPGTGSFSIDGWVATSDTTADQLIASEAATDAAGCLDAGSWALSIAADGTADLDVITGSSGATGSPCSAPTLLRASASSLAPALNDGAWHYVAAAVCQSCGTVTVWVDGVAQTTSGLVAGSLSSGDQLRLASEPAGSAYAALDGALDEIAFYRSALTDDQVENHYKSAYGTDDGSNDGSGTTLDGGSGAPAMVPTSNSVYVTSTVTKNGYDSGCSQGRIDAAYYGVNRAWSTSAVVLDFGGQNSANTGTKFITNDGTGATYAQVAAYAEQFGKGYYDCAGAKGDRTTKIFVALGTNNSASQVSTTGGSKWATSVVQAARSWVASHGYASQVFIWGADDLETGYSDPAAARAWVAGFTSRGYNYIDYGDAGACSWTSYQNATCYSGGFRWKQADVYAVAWGNAYAFTYPEIYMAPNGGCPDAPNGEMPQQWTLVSRYGYYYGNHGKILFFGPMIEFNAGCTATQAWTLLWNELNKDTTLPLGSAGLKSTSVNMSYITQIGMF